LKIKSPVFSFLKSLKVCRFLYTRFHAWLDFKFTYWSGFFHSCHGSRINFLEIWFLKFTYWEPDILRIWPWRHGQTRSSDIHISFPLSDSKNTFECCFGIWPELSICILCLLIRVRRLQYLLNLNLVSYFLVLLIHYLLQCFYLF